MMRRSRLVWQVTVPFALLLAIGVFAVSWQAARLMRGFHLQQVERELASASALVEAASAGALASRERESADPLAKQLGRSASLRVTIVAPDGTVLGESDGDPATMDNHATRPEIAAAREKGTGTAIRYSDTISTDMMYSARAVAAGGRLIGFVRTGVALSAVAEADRALRRRTAGVAAVVVALTITLGFWFVRRVARPLEELQELAGEYAQGRLDRKLPSSGSIEVRRVGDAMQKMAAELDSRIAALEAERNEQEAVLASMVEGVLAIDPRERVMSMNAAAARLLETDERQATGRTIHEIARSTDLQRFVVEALEADSPIERDVALRGDESRFIQAHGAPVRDAAGRRIGAVVVLNDVTRLRRLETVRRDFVANVSHELKTPVTSIKGFLETLLSGALEDPANARRFVEIAARQADRLGAIIEDLLVLSRIDAEAGSPAIERSPTALEAVVRGAVDVCRAKADRKGIGIEIDCRPELRARINAALVEQALVNLVDNAIKYSGEGSRVEIVAAAEDGFATVAVRDRGPGIDAEHLPRLFERFYRVDKARSRGLGGTGLGLAIVKHIAQAQGGSVDVESSPGAGSTFTLRFPLA